MGLWPGETSMEKGARCLYLGREWPHPEMGHTVIFGAEFPRVYLCGCRILSFKPGWELCGYTGCLLKCPCSLTSCVQKCSGIETLCTAEGDTQIGEWHCTQSPLYCMKVPEALHSFSSLEHSFSSSRKR